jgi:hypothetical protein
MYNNIFFLQARRFQVCIKLFSSLQETKTKSKILIKNIITPFSVIHRPLTGKSVVNTTSKSNQLTNTGISSNKNQEIAQISTEISKLNDNIQEVTNEIVNVTIKLAEVEIEIRSASSMVLEASSDYLRDFWIKEVDHLRVREEYLRRNKEALRLKDANLNAQLAKKQDTGLNSSLSGKYK